MFAIIKELFQKDTGVGIDLFVFQRKLLQCLVWTFYVILQIHLILKKQKKEPTEWWNPYLCVLCNIRIGRLTENLKFTNVFVYGDFLLLFIAKLILGYHFFFLKKKKKTSKSPCLMPWCSLTSSLEFFTIIYIFVIKVFSIVIKYF